MKSNTYAHMTETLGPVLLGPLMLVGPFIAFVNHNGYSLFKVEILFCLILIISIGLAFGLGFRAGDNIFRAVLAALLTVMYLDFQTDWFGNPLTVFQQDFSVRWLLASAAVSLATLFYFLGRRLIPVLLVIFFGLVVGAFAVPSDDLVKLQQDETEVSGNRKRGLPPVLHIVLDGQIGVEGIPYLHRASRKYLRQFYLTRNFTVFGKAYSRYYKTFDSLSNLVNFSAMRKKAFYFNGAFSEGASIDRNEYFKRMNSLGYKINVFQTDHLDFCNAGNGARPAFCLTHKVESIKSLENEQYSGLQKAKIIITSYLKLSPLLKKAIGERRLESRVAHISAMGLWQLFRERMQKPEDGTLTFLHLLLPHLPFGFDESCSQKILPMMARLSQPKVEKYEGYLDQMRCTHSMIDELIVHLRETGVYEHYMIIIHGDHGSRITGSGLDDHQVLDDHSTLFAFKRPHGVAHYDSRLLPIDALFKSIIDDGSVPDGNWLRERPFIYNDSGAGAGIYNKYPLSRANFLP